MEKAADIIGRNKYEMLKRFNKDLSEQELKQIEDYENARRPEITPLKEREKVKLIPGVPATKKNIWIAFKTMFKEHTGREFIENAETINNIAPIINYFAKDKGFFTCTNLVKKIEGVDLSLSFEKGLLIVGAYGNGKTTVMTVLEKAFNWMYEEAVDNKWDTVKDWANLRFRGYKSHDIVTEFEIVNSPEAKENFYKKYKGFRLYIDDLKKEQKASNYGSTEIIRVIFEKRHDNNAITYGTCNYKEKSKDLELALQEFGERYGGHIYDRIFSMFNIIEFRGTSFRK